MDDVKLFFPSRICGMLSEGSLQDRETFFKEKHMQRATPQS